MSHVLQDLLAQRPWLLADGATGTNYFKLGLETGDAPEFWNIDHPERVQQVHRGFVEAGSDIILTNSFGGTRNRLRLHKAEDRVAELNRAAARLAREVADQAGRPVVVAGSMGPTGDIMQPVGPLSPEDAEAAFAEQAQALAEGGADALWIETISALEELRAAFAGARKTGLPIVCTLSFDTNGRTMMGVSPAQLAELAHELAPDVVAFGGNCGTGPSELMAGVLNMAAARRPEDVLVAKANCGIPQYVEGEIVYSGTPELMADYARLALDSGVRIIGGCCGTTPEHIASIRQALESHQPGSLPSMEQVTARLGAVSRGAEAGAVLPTQGAGTGGRRRRSRSGAAEDEAPRF